MNAYETKQFSIKAHEDKYGPVGLSESGDGVYVTPYSNGTKKYSWALYVFSDGSAHLYTARSQTGALLGKPTKLPKPELTSNRCQVLLKKGSVNVIGAMLPKFAEKDSFPCNLPAHRLCLPEELGEGDRKGIRPIWICPGHDEITKL